MTKALDVNGDVPQVRIFSMNCWGLKYIAKHRVARLTEISHRIAAASPQHDIVALQEFWVHSDYLTLRRLTSTILPYGKFYFSGAIGGGLVILSKWPIASSSMFRYPLNGRPTAFFRGDYYVGKGVASATIAHPSGQTIEVFNTHLHAPYEEKDTYLCHRTAQAWEIAKLMRGAAQRGHVVIGAGDFNMIPSSLAHRIISTHGLVCDSWLSANPTAPDMPPSDATAAENLVVSGITCDSVLNTWRMPGPHPSAGAAKDPWAKRLDYVFHTPSSSAVRSVVVGMTEPMSMPSQTGGKGGAAGVSSLSDHYSVEVILSLAPSPAQQAALAAAAAARQPDSVPSKTLIDVAGSARAAEVDVAHQIDDDEVSTERKLPVDILDGILAVQKEYTDREKREYFWRIAHFWASIPVVIGCNVAVWWSPHNGVSFALMMLCWVVAVTGVMDGLIGFLFTGSELRALAEFEEEVRMYREQQQQQQQGNSDNGRNHGNDDEKCSISIIYR